MPPRHTYWTIILEGKPTAFRAHTQEELLPTLRQLQSKHPDTVLMWFARGRLWKSEEESRAAYSKSRPPGDRRGPAWRPGGSHEDPRARFKIPRDEKRRRFRERLFRDQVPRRSRSPGAGARAGTEGRTAAARVSATSGRAAREARGSARGPRMDGRRVKPIGRRGRTARRISVQGRVLDRRTENPAGNQVDPRDRSGGDRGWKPSRPAGQGAAAAIAVGNQVGQGQQGRRAVAGIAGGNQVDPRDQVAAAATAVGNRAGPAGQGSGGGDRGWKPSRPAGPSGGGDRGWKPSRPAGKAAVAIVWKP